ncbi:MAG TPA: tetraacyldisaccharide 4'-kinase [Candidatus Acidoferrales bacterium]|nr:tetraacyldisaccharide 4'-kinase [Candidatus Acidoferrales bacterium]
MTLKESLLWPLSIPYAAVARLRARAYRQGILRRRRLDGVVISVGNLTVGGTGKTPMVLSIAERLLAEGKSVGILTRGYCGKTVSGSTDKSQATNNPAAAVSTSDEVELLQSRLGDRALFGVGADRYKHGVELAARGVKWFVLDDGFQHLQLTRDVDVVLIDASRPFRGGHLLPAGRLREPRSALERADLIVITRSRHAPALESVIRHHSAAPIFYAHTELASLRSHTDSKLAMPEATSKLFFAFCGIGNPGAFLADLRYWGFQIVGHKFFPDHHRYSASDIVAIERDARKAGAVGLICTEKDRFNLTDAEPSMDLWVCAISLRIDREDDFWSALMKKAESSHEV